MIVVIIIALSNELASLILDRLGLVHRLTDWQLELSDDRLSIDSWTSRTVLLVAVVVTGLIVTAARRRPLLLIPGYLASAVVTFVLVRAVSICCLAGLHLWFDEPWRQVCTWALAVICPLAGMGLMVSADQLLKIVCYPATSTYVDSRRYNPLVAVWNRLFSKLSKGTLPAGQSRVASKKRSSLFVALLSAPISGFPWSLDFLFRWCMTRPLAGLWLAAPAGVCCCVGGLLITGSLQLGNGGRQTRYSQQLTKAIDSKDWPLAVLTARVLMDLQPGSEQWALQHAVALDRQGSRTEAIGEMRALVQSTNSHRAAFWLVVHCYDLDDLSNWQPSEHAEFQQLLKLAMSAAPDPLLNERLLILARYQAGTGARQEALSLYEKLSASHWEHRIAAALLSQSLGQPERAAQHAQQAIPELERLLTRDAQDTASRLRLARLLLVTQQPQPAIDLLQSAPPEAATTELNLLLGEALVKASLQMKQQAATADSRRQRLVLVSRALRASPDHPLANDALVELAIECYRSDDVESRELLKATLQETDSTVLHFIRGSVAAVEDRMLEAEQHFRQAAQTGKPMPGLLNNLAVAIQSRPDGDLQQALRLVDLALSQMAHPYFSETRGQILAKLGRDSEAIAALEKALESEDLTAAILPTLVQCYRNVGSDVMAEHYAKRLRELQ